VSGGGGNYDALVHGLYRLVPLPLRVPAKVSQKYREGRARKNTEREGRDVQAARAVNVRNAIPQFLQQIVTKTSCCKASAARLYRQLDLARPAAGAAGVQQLLVTAANNKKGNSVACCGGRGRYSATAWSSLLSSAYSDACFSKALASSGFSSRMASQSARAAL
jgi:hypothetical protein